MAPSRQDTAVFQIDITPQRAATNDRFLRLINFVNNNVACGLTTYYVRQHGSSVLLTLARVSPSLWGCLRMSIFSDVERILRC
jgi:hypothetical protein